MRKKAEIARSEARLEVPGRGDHGRPLEIASCSSAGASQLSSRAASGIIDVFRRIRRSSRVGSRFVGHCPDFAEPRKEIAPGVRAWWATEE
jgi:hypothetical protein